MEKEKDASYCRSTKSIISKLSVRIDWYTNVANIECKEIAKVSCNKEFLFGERASSNPNESLSVSRVCGKLSQILAC